MINQILKEVAVVGATSCSCEEEEEEEDKIENIGKKIPICNIFIFSKQSLVTLVLVEDHSFCAKPCSIV
jgi:hypothetical protein